MGRIVRSAALLQRSAGALLPWAVAVVVAAVPAPSGRGGVSATGSQLMTASGVASTATEELTEEPLPFDPAPPIGPARARVAALTALGRKLFNDPTLSASGRMACASCHDPAHGFGPPDAAPVRMGGAKLDRPGTRAVPGLTYAQFSPFFDEHHYDEDDEGDGGLDVGPTGGRTWDGRVSRARDQASLPLLSTREMANADPAAVVAKATAAEYAADLRVLYGDTIFEEPARAFAAIAEALEIYQEYPPDFGAFTSKYDAFLRGLVQLTEQEQRGLAAFNDPDRGNCAHCHISRLSTHGALPLFTDFGFVALGLPRNKFIPANADPAYFDLGLCGPEREDFADRKEYCGLFKTPSLRNVALRPVFFHNGVISELRDAVAFYAARDVSPGRWYPINKDGTVRQYDDLPAEYRENVNREPPFTRGPGDAPALTEQEITDIAAFLMTLTDGFSPDLPAAVTGSGPGLNSMKRGIQ
jgi:cytochrome c peroxidase